MPSINGLSPNNGGVIHNIQNYSNYHIEMPQQIIIGNQTDAMSIDRIIDENAKEIIMN